MILIGYFISPFQGSEFHCLILSEYVRSGSEKTTVRTQSKIINQPITVLPKSTFCRYLRRFLIRFAGKSFDVLLTFLWASFGNLLGNPGKTKRMSKDAPNMVGL